MPSRDNPATLNNRVKKRKNSVQSILGRIWTKHTHTPNKCEIWSGFWQFNVQLMLQLNLWRANACLHAWPMTAWLWSSVVEQTCFFQKLLCDLLTSQQSSCESSIMFKHWYGVYQRLLKCQLSNKGWRAVSTQSITGVTLNPTEWITRAFTTPHFVFFLCFSPFVLTGTR